MANDFYRGASADAASYFSSLPRQVTSAVQRKNSWRAVFIIAIVVLVISLAALGSIALSYFQGQQKYTALQDNARTEEADLASLSVDWKALKAINPNTVAWVYIPGTKVNYPVVRGDDNEYYLSHDFGNGQGWLANFGAIFMDYRNIPTWGDDAYYLYGHHMNDGSMFAAIADMADQGRFDAERDIYLLSPYGNFKLRTFSLVHCGAEDSLVRIAFKSVADMTEYVQDIMDQSVVNAGDLPQAKDITQIFAFSTCDNYSVARYVLFAYVQESTVPTSLKKQKPLVAEDDAGGNADVVNDRLIEPEVLEGSQELIAEEEDAAAPEQAVEEEYFDEDYFPEEPGDEEYYE